ncbi:hypothetical protein [Sporosarcina sp. G11-34]|uniref:hypothetical protein n=1 Tax=Sporosarcina sp. G11-34 TaxID=2849605 RepID=UPI0022A9802C|nr:hypothetical protein [Sporosarcina sp. G11-34]MCZ2258408.1 hypothetical protein [Sporosarcina sp. G11-34]
MKWRTKWFFAIVLTIGVIGVTKLEEKGVIDEPVTQYITTGEDFLVMKKWVASILEESDGDQVAVSVSQKGEPLSLYESMQPYKDGVLISYESPLAIEAQGNGLIIFTGYTRRTGKTVTVLYDSGDEVTYGFVGTFSKLPYTTVKRGDTLALMDVGAIFLMVKQGGAKLDSSMLPAYLSGSAE